MLTTIHAIDPGDYKPSGEEHYPDSNFGIGLRQVAMIVKTEVGMEVACPNVGGWDTQAD